MIARVVRAGVSWARFGWATLTSMRTALLLLLVLGLAAIPGSLLPQRPTDPVKVSQWLAANPGWAWIDRLGAFDVFGSAWFAAIYLLLFISLVGCILPRTVGFARALRAAPSPGPKQLDRLPGCTEVPLADTAAGLDAAEAHLRARHYRVVRDGDAITAERGYLREAGNLVFHCCLVLALIGVAVGSLFSFTGTAIVVEGQAFSNTLTQYDDFRAGAGFTGSQLVPFTLRLDAFHVRFETGPVQRGSARSFDADVALTRADGGTSRQDLQVNAPLELDGTQVSLLGHGYAPVVTVTDGNGAVAFSGPVVFLPQDANFRSDGVVKAPDARPQRLAFEGVFLPTAASGGSSGMVSAFPDALNPRLLLNAWAGAPRTETGRSEKIYVLDPTGLTQFKDASGNPVTAGLAVGDTLTLPDGAGSIRFDGWKRWTKLQISTTPGAWLVLVAVMLAVAGMTVSLSVKPRRLFVRVVGPAAPVELVPSTPGDGGSGETAGGAAGHGAPRLAVAGLDRVEGRGGLPESVAALAAAVATLSDNSRPSASQPSGPQPSGS